jgi:hypothetical protein
VQQSLYAFAYTITRSHVEVKPHDVDNARRDRHREHPHPGRTVTDHRHRLHKATKMDLDEAEALFLVLDTMLHPEEE